MALDKSCFVVIIKGLLLKLPAEDPQLLLLANEEDPLNSWLPCTQRGGRLSPEGAGEAVGEAFKGRAKSSGCRLFCGDGGG